MSVVPTVLRRAFVAGATGFTGREVVHLLGASTCHVVAHIRPDSPRLETWRNQFEVWGAQVDTSPWTPEAMTAALRAHSPDAVFALLGTTRARGRAGDRVGDTAATYETVDYGLTRVLLDATAAIDVSPRFVYLSAAGVRPDSRGAYYRARARAEAAIVQSRVPHTIARPSFIVGADGRRRDDDRPWERIGARAADAALGVARRLGARRLAARYQAIDNAALARALVELAGEPSAADRVIEAEVLRAAT